MTNSHSIWVKLNRYTPILVRLLAKTGPTRPMTNEEIRLASKGVLTLADVQYLSLCPSWDGVPVGKMRAFCIACGIDFSNRETMRTMNRYLRNRPTFSHLKGHLEDPVIKASLNEYLKYESGRA